MLRPTEEARLRGELETAREEIRQLKAAMSVHDATAQATRLGISVRGAEILLLLVRRGHANFDQLYDALFDDEDDSCMEWRQAVRQYVKRLRQKLRPHGISIQSIYGHGYRMDEASRAKARELLERPA